MFRQSVTFFICHLHMRAQCNSICVIDYEKNTRKFLYGNIAVDFDANRIEIILTYSYTIILYSSTYSHIDNIYT